MKNKSIFFCNECGYETPKWLGKCPGCGAWNSMVEEKIKTETNHKKTSASKLQNKAKKLKDVDMTADKRISTGIGEFDRVLGGGIVKGSLVLVGGDPGIGKSTLLLQMCKTIGASGTILYVSAEESNKQIKMRAQRLGVENDNLLLFSETELGTITEEILELLPDVVIIDSIQTIYSEDVSSAPGSVTQVREASASLMRIAKENEIPVFIVGHVTKDGAIAGPKVLEHMVDCVLYFEGDRHKYNRILRSVKNRFGSTNEIGVFEMRDKGLMEILNPSMMLIDGRPEDISGSCVVCTMEGTRPVLAEIQALVSKTSFPVPRRMSDGIDYNRLVLLIAVLEKKVGLKLGFQDVYANVVGGLRIDEPAADLGVALAVSTGFIGNSIGKHVLAIGEVGLTGEVRSVNMIEKRVNEAKKLGFTEIVVPKGNKGDFTVPDGVKIHYVSNLKEAINIF